MIFKFLTFTLIFSAFASFADGSFRNCYLKVSRVDADGSVRFNMVSSEKEGGGQKIEIFENISLSEGITAIEDAAFAGACDADHLRSVYSNCDCAVEVQSLQLYKIRGCDVEGVPTYFEKGLRSSGARVSIFQAQSKGYCRQ